MEKLFQTVLGMSGTASIVILLVLLVRLALWKAPRVFSYVLWAVVLFRLLCPFSIESGFSLLPTVPSNSAGAGLSGFRIQTGISALNPQGNQYLTDHPVQTPPAPVRDTQETVPDNLPVPEEKAAPAPAFIAAAIWLTGAAALAAYSLISLLALRRRLVGSIPLAGEKNVRLADRIPSPFVLGVFRPRIYLPSDLPEEERDYILLHEHTHIRRRDHIFRALAWAALAIHWFNPLVWLAFHLAGKDMEMSCDEAVLRKMDRDVRADYSSSLLRLSTEKRLPAGPLAFGDGDPQSRIKNVLRYKKPAVWVIAAALIAVLCAAAALATNPSGPIISPDSVTAVTSFSASAYTVTPENTIVYTTADLRKDLLNPVNPRTISLEDGTELIRLINSHRKTVYGHGELTLSGNEHGLTRIDCADGSFYLVDYWYWNGFSFHPFHAGEDSYTTLVTCFDAQGNPGTTWQMEYDFDKAYQDWRSSLPDDGVPVSFHGERAADLTLSMDEDGLSVRIEGSIGGAALERTHWFFPDWFAQFGPDYEASYPLGKLWFYDKGVGCDLDACWTDESRSAVKVTATPRAMISSYMLSGNLIYTVALTEDGGRLLELEGYLPKLSAGTPEIVPTEAEAVAAACVAAKLMTAAEDFYRNYRQSVPQDPRLDLTFYASEYGECMVGGLGGLRVEWHPPTPFTPLNAIMYSVTGWLYFAGDPAVLCPRLTGESVEGHACWADETQSALQVQFVVNDDRVVSGTVSGFSVRFTVDLERMAVTDRAFESQVEGETLELTDQEMADMAQVLAQVLEEAEAYFYDAANEPNDAPVPATQPPGSASPAASPSPAPSDPPSSDPSDTPSPAPSAAPSASPEPEPVQSVFPSVPAPDLPGELICSSSYHMSGGDYRTVDFDAVPSGGKHIRFSFTDLSGKPVWVYLLRVDDNDEPGGEIVSSFALEGGQQGWADYYADDADSGTYYVLIVSRVSGRDVVEGGTYVSQY